MASASAHKRSAFLVAGEATNIEPVITVLWPRNGGAVFPSALIHDHNQTERLERRCNASPKRLYADFAYLLRDRCDLWRCHFRRLCDLVARLVTLSGVVRVMGFAK